MQEKGQNIAESDDSARFDGRVSFGGGEVCDAAADVGVDDIRWRTHSTARKNDAGQSADFDVHVGGR